MATELHESVRTEDALFAPIGEGEKDDEADVPIDLELVEPRPVDFVQLSRLAGTKVSSEIRATVGPNIPLLVYHGFTPFGRGGARLRGALEIGYEVATPSATCQACRQGSRLNFVAPVTLSPEDPSAAMERGFTLESVPTEPTSSVWEGTLSPRPDIEPDVARGVLDRELDVESLKTDPPRITIGRPEVLRSLRAGAPEGFEHVEPRDFYLVRLWCSFLSFRTDLVFDHAHFQVTLAAPGTDTATVVAHDLYPSEVMHRVKRNVKFSLSPELKFAEIGGSLGGLEYGFEYDELQPSIVAAGQGQATPSWMFAATKGSRLLGGKAVHMVVAAPAETPSVEAGLELIVHVTKPGLIPLPMGILDAKGQIPAEPLKVKLW